jgi:hypothetical protein
MKKSELKSIKKLQEQNRLRRIGPAKGGYWRSDKVLYAFLLVIAKQPIANFKNDPEQRL